MKLDEMMSQDGDGRPRRSLRAEWWRELRRGNVGRMKSVPTRPRQRRQPAPGLVEMIVRMDQTKAKGVFVHAAVLCLPT